MIKTAFFTKRNIFLHPEFIRWARTNNIDSTPILEPFAGSNNIINMLESIGLCSSFKAYDIESKHKMVEIRDTIKDFPTGFKNIISNPPYLAKNSATKQGYKINTKYDDLYKDCLELCLNNADNVALILPASFITSSFNKERLVAYIMLPYKDMFTDTDHPVCLALFEKNVATSTKIYNGDIFLGYLEDMLSVRDSILGNTSKEEVQFNIPASKVGLYLLDGTNSRIRFVHGNEISDSNIKYSSRTITKINIPERLNDIDALNLRLNKYRELTYDIFLTPFRGLRNDGLFRRKLSFGIARQIILS